MRSPRPAFSLVELPEVSGRERVAFSLVELLVVIGILAIVLGILLPTLSKARLAAKRTQCASQLRQIGVGLHRYFNDYRALPERPGALARANPHVFKWAGSPTPADDVSELMEKYCGPRTIFYCPDNKEDRTPDAWWPFTTGSIAVTYQFPFWFTRNNWRIQYPDYRRLTSDRLLAADVLATNDGVNTIIQHNHTLSNGGDPNGMNELFGDGHVKWVVASRGWVNYSWNGGVVFWHYAQY